MYQRSFWKEAGKRGRKSTFQTEKRAKQRPRDEPDSPLGPQPALTGRPALSQRLSGRGLPAKMTQGRDTGCPSSTRTVEALLAICGGAVGRGASVGHTRSPWWSSGGQRPPPTPPHPGEMEEASG